MNSPSKATNPIKSASWRLDSLYKSPEDILFKQDLANLSSDIKSFMNRHKGKLKFYASSSVESLASCISEYESLRSTCNLLVSYAQLYSAQDQSNKKAQKFLGDVTRKIYDYNSDLIFFELELNALSKVSLKEAFSKSSALRHYKPWLENIRLYKPHELSEDLEKLFLEKSLPSCNSWIRLFDEFFSVLRFKIDNIEYNLDSALNILLSSDRSLRKLASDSLSEVFKQNSWLFRHITNTLIQNQAIEDRWRSFSTPESSRHLSNQISPSLVNSLERSVVSYYERISHRYYGLKADMMGLDYLYDYDRNAPLKEGGFDQMSWQEAQSIVLSSYNSFNSEMGSIASDFFSSHRIDATLRPGKTGGAFSHPVSCKARPYILMNYHGSKRDVMTLAHELGHGIHQTLSAPLGELQSDTPLTLAETASVFGEMLVFRHLVSNCKSKEEKRILLAAKIEDKINTVMRQISFHRFEKKLHEEGRKGELSTNDICDIWLDTQKECLGNRVKLRPGYETYWCYIPHFIHSSFYVYAYAFGECVVNSLYRCYERDKAAFIPPYLDLLRSGGSVDCTTLLSKFGYDINKDEFWHIGLDLIEDLIDELESLG